MTTFFPKIVRGAYGVCRPLAAKKNVSRHTPPQKRPVADWAGGWRSVEAVGGAHPVGPWHDQNAVRRAWGRATGRVVHPPRLTQSAWSVEGAFCGVAGGCGDGSPSLWLHHHKRGRSAPLQRPRLGSSPHLPHPVQRGASQGGSVATSAHPVPRHRHPPTVDTKNRRPAPLSGHQMHRFVSFFHDQPHTPTLPAGVAQHPVFGVDMRCLRVGDRGRHWTR